MQAGRNRSPNLLFSRGGMSWFGGLIGGVGAGMWWLHRRAIPIMAGLAAAAPGLAIGHAIGRIGCFLVGDDYGRPTELPWGVAFPKGLPPTDIPVHPTQLYEMALLLPIASARSFAGGGPASRTAWCSGDIWCSRGVARFGIEFIRVNEPVAGPFTLAQLISAGVTIAGIALLTKRPA
jgi:phosphatidylglycerol:prolipoprotein diacylglycerol transferase